MIAQAPANREARGGEREVSFELDGRYFHGWYMVSQEVQRLLGGERADHTSGAEKAVRAGIILLKAREAAGWGEMSQVYRRAGVGERTGQRLIRMARECATGDAPDRDKIAAWLRGGGKFQGEPEEATKIDLERAMGMRTAPPAPAPPPAAEPNRTRPYARTDLPPAAAPCAPDGPDGHDGPHGPDGRAAGAAARVEAVAPGVEPVGALEPQVGRGRRPEVSGQITFPMYRQKLQAVAARVGQAWDNLLQWCMETFGNDPARFEDTMRSEFHRRKAELVESIEQDSDMSPQSQGRGRVG